MASSQSPALVGVVNIDDGRFDCVVLVIDSLDSLAAHDSLLILKGPLESYAEADQSTGSSPTFICVDGLPHKRLVYSCTGPLNRDYDDARRFSEAADAGIKRAMAAGSRSPLLVCPRSPVYTDATLCGILGSLHALYVPLEIREDVPSKATKADKLGVWNDGSDSFSESLRLAAALEAGRGVARDIGGSDPERMAAPRVEGYVRAQFADTSVKVGVVSGQESFEKQYPLLAAVNRAARNVDRHHGRVIFLEYQGEGEVDETLLLVGKGITYDTGGADVKAGGHMAGMHRDKCGAAAVAGFFKTLDILKPKGIKVMGALCMVRNSIGSECYVADEIITSRAGVRVRVGNTDAEGRMVMTDVLCHMKEKALNEVNPKIFTWATLTGHVIIAHGDQYSAVMGNGPSVAQAVPAQLIENGAEIADPCQLSTIMREDYKFAKGPSEYEDVLQCNNEPSSRTPRGHQFPAAFMILASGLDKHGRDSSQPLSYCHVDVAGSSGPYPGIPTGAPIAAFARTFLMKRL